MRRILISLSAVFALSATDPALAAKGYVSDQLVVSLREGEGDQFKMIRMLRTGTPVEILSERGEHVRVRTEDGVEGYVFKKYITAETPKAITIARLEQENEKLKSRVQELEAAAPVRSEGGQPTEGGVPATALQTELQTLQEKYRALEQQSANVVQLTAERDRLEAQNAELAAEVQTLRGESSREFSSGAFKWFLGGAGVLLVGWLIGRGSKGRRRGYTY